MDNLSAAVIFIGQGIGLSLGLLIGGLTIGLMLGTLFAIMRANNIGGFFIKPFISFIRGTPLLLQLSFVYFALPVLCHLELSLATSGIITFGLNSAAFIAEILRGGINGIAKGQFEAARSLKIPPFYIWKDIILPQVFKTTAPALVNETIALFKETALISTLGGMDLMRRAQMIAAEHFTYFMPLMIAALYYYFMILLFEQLGKQLMQKVQYD